MKKLIAGLALSLLLSLSFSFARVVRAQDGQPTQAPGPTAAAATPARTGSVTGQLTNGTAGGTIPGSLAMMLHAWDEAGETLMLDGTVDEKGAFRFDNVEMQTGWTFAAMLAYNDVTFYSESAPVTPESNEISLPLTVYETSTDASAVLIAQLHTLLDYAGGEVTVGEVYVLSNASDRVVAGAVDLADGRKASLEFALPDGANKVSFEANSSKAAFSMIDAARFADSTPLQPGSGRTQVIVQYTLPYRSGMEIAHAILYPMGGVNIIQRADAGVTIAGPGLAEPTTTTMGDGGSYLVYALGPVPALAGVTLTLTGEPNYQAIDGAAPAAGAASPSGLAAGLQRAALPIAGGALGLTLVGLGVWWLRRAGRQETEEEDSGHEPATGSAGHADWTGVLHAIAQLDAAHERGEIPEADYAEQRTAMKAQARAVLQAEQTGN